MDVVEKHGTERWVIEAGRADRSSTIVDVEQRTVTESGFLATPAGDLFVTVHAPADSPRAVVVVCSPLLAEAARNYRREYLVAEALASAGIACARFHYRGSGHSVDVPAATLEEMVEDARRVTSHVVEWSGTDRIGFLGTRVGGVVAALVRADHGAAPLALWAPVVSGSAYVRDLLRARMITNLKGGGAESMAALKQRLASGDSIEIAGYELSAPLSASLGPLDPTSAFGTARGSLRVVDLDGAGRTSRHLAAACAAWTSGGGSVTTDVLAFDEPWWFGATPDGDRYPAKTTGLQLVADAVSFFETAFETAT